MNGPNQLIPYALIRVQQRLAKDKTIGALLIEPTFTRASFLGSDGRVEMHRSFPTIEIAEALREIDNAVGSDSPPANKWLGGIAGAFDQRWGELQVVERLTFDLDSSKDLSSAVRERLRSCLDRQASAPGTRD